MKYIALFLVLLALPAAAQPTPTITARLISPQTAVGDTATIPLALQLTLPTGWHTYWRTPGIAGIPPSLTWETQTNVTNVDIQYPTPQRITSMGLDTFGYHDAVTFPLVATLAEAGKPLSLKGRLDIVMCTDICVPANALIELALPAGATTASADAPVWQAAIDALPLKASPATITSITRANNTLAITLQHDAASQFTDVIAENADSIILRAATVTPVTGGSQFTTQFDTASEAPLLDSKPVTLTFLGTPNAIELTGTVGSTTVAASSPPAGEGWGEGEEKNSIISILLIALLGGLILNLMPCVLPVLSLKLLTIISHAGSDSAAQIRRGFIASSLGILTSFWLLAAGTIALKQTGMALGWGLQFQHPGFLLGIVIVLLVFAANLFGLFEFRLPHTLQNKLGKPSDGTGVTKEFLTGMAAAVLATPCSAPFVGTAISFALAQSSGTILSIFTALGLGLASPYLLVALFPRIAQHLPRPGAWMQYLRTFMGILLIGSAVWFGSVLVVQISTGQNETLRSPQGEAGWQPFAPETIPALVAQGKTVFLDITAKWCLTCHANKGFVLNVEPTRSALQAENIVLMQADWTRPSDVIQAYLKSFNRYGIPFNVVFGPGAPQGIVLPELLTDTAIAEALEKAR